LEGGEVLKGQAIPGEAELNGLVWALNDIHRAFWFRKTTAPESQFKHARASREREAIEVLMCFFDQRRQASTEAERRIASALAAAKPRSARKAGKKAALVIDRERRLYDLFRDFVHAMTTHDFQLDMDIDTGALMPRLESWHHVADGIAGAFRIAMFPKEFGSSNGKRGKTSGGMILRFSGGRESDSFWEWRRPGILTVCRTPS